MNRPLPPAWLIDPRLKTSPRDQVAAAIARLRNASPGNERA